MQLHAVTWNSGVGAMQHGLRRRAAARSAGAATVAGGDRLGLGHRHRRRHVGDVEDVVDRAAVRQLGALREAGRARRVEDRGVVVGIDVDLGQRVGSRVGHHDVVPSGGVGRQALGRSAPR